MKTPLKKFYSDLYRYYAKIGLNVQYMSYTRKNKEAHILKAIYNKAPEYYEDILEFGIEHDKPIGWLSYHLPELINRFQEDYDIEFELKEGYKYSGEEKRAKYKEWKINHSR